MKNARSPSVNNPATALSSLLQRLRPVESESIALKDASGRILAEALRADRPSPACSVSAMDGYALRLEDLKHLSSARGLLFRHIVTAGQPAPVLAVGCACKVMTGAMVPDNAEAVIRREDVDESPERIVLKEGAGLIAAGQDIRRVGENLPKGAEVLGEGHLIHSALAGALAAFGHTQVHVYRKLRVALLITGDEVLPPEEQPQPWQLRDSNGPALRALMSGHPWVDLTVVLAARDRRETLREALEGVLGRCDVVVLTGGVSAGDYDYVPDVIAAANGEIIFHGLAIRPGKPVLGAVGPAGQLILGLPGNPVSVLVTAQRLGLPAMAARAGLRGDLAKAPSVTIANADGQTINLWWYRLVRLVEPGRAELVENHGSGDLVGSARADGFVEIPPGARGSGPWPFYQWA
jgi:molybdopterin molybdotransferase